MNSMKLLPAAALLLVLPASARTFTSADGTKKIEADLIDYRPSTDTVVIQYEGQSTRRTVKASAFSEADLEYFKEFLKGKTMREGLKVTSTEVGERSKDEGDLYTYDRLTTHCAVSVRNAGKAPVEGLNAKYDLYIQRGGKDGDRQVEVVSGEVSLDDIPVNLDTTFETESVKLTLGCETSSSCPKCEEQASSVQRERLIGLRVRLYNEDDELMSEHYSNSSVKTVAANLDEKRG